MPKLLRTIRLDPSDTFVFDRAAEPGEWAVPGSALFGEADWEEMPTKLRVAFRSGFLGLNSFGFSTLTEVALIDEGERDRLVLGFTQALMNRFGAPDQEAAAAMARDEIAFAESLCDHVPGTTIAMHRTIREGAVQEQFRTLHRREGQAPGADRLHAFARAFEFVEVEEPEDRVDLVGLTRQR